MSEQVLQCENPNSRPADLGKSEKYIFLFYILCFLIIAASVALFQPLQDTPPLYGNPPDEHARYLVPKYICEHGTLPTGFEEEIRIPAYGFSYGIYNVFPYIIQGYFMRFVSLFTDSELILLYAARSVNVLSGVLMAVVVYLLSKRLFRDRRFAWLFCFAVMYLPESLFMHTYVNTDSMCLLSTAMMVHAWVSAYQDGFHRKNILCLSGGIILCALSYYNAYGFILSSILLFLSYFLTKRDGRSGYDWKEMLKKGSVISAIVLLGIGWWFLRSYLLYDGDMLGLRTREEMSIQYGIQAVNPLNMNTYRDKGYTIWQMIKENGFFTGAFLTFVAAYGSLSIIGSVWIYRIYKVLLGAGILSYFLIWKKGIPKVTREFRWKKINGKRLFFHINMLFCAVMPLILLIYYAYDTDYQNQGRYLLPGIIPIMYYVTAGLEKLAGLKWVPEWLKNLGVWASCVCIVGCLIWMVYGYAFPVYMKIGMVIQ